MKNIKNEQTFVVPVFDTCQIFLPAEIRNKYNIKPTSASGLKIKLAVIAMVKEEKEELELEEVKEQKMISESE